MEVDEGSDEKITHLSPLDGCALKNEFTQDEKCHNLMSWLKYKIIFCSSPCNVIEDAE